MYCSEIHSHDHPWGPQKGGLIGELVYKRDPFKYKIIFKD